MSTNPLSNSFAGLSAAGLSPADRALGGASFRTGSSLARLTGRQTIDAEHRSPLDEAKQASQEAFASVLSQHVTQGPASKPFGSLTPAQRDERTRQAAEDFVAVAFVQPVLKNLRSGGVTGELPPPFGPGPGEKQFRTIADAQLAKSLVHASRWPLVQNLTKRLQTGPANTLSKEALKNAPTLPGSAADIKRRAAAKTAATKTAADDAKPAAAPAAATTAKTTTTAAASAKPTAAGKTLDSPLSFFPSR